MDSEVLENFERVASQIASHWRGKAGWFKALSSVEIFVSAYETDADLVYPS